MRGRERETEVGKDGETDFVEKNLVSEAVSITALGFTIRVTFGLDGGVSVL